MAVFIGTVEAFATATVVRTLSVTSQPTVAIDTSKLNDFQNINPENGNHSGLNASFTLQTNGSDENYIYILGSKIISSGNVEVPAYSADGKALLFGRIGEEEYLPTTEAIEDAKNGGSNNPNVIAYPCTITISEPMTAEFQTDIDLDGETVDGYVVKVNTASEGVLDQKISGSPVSGTYSPALDMAGTYKAVVYFTAISK